MKLWGHQEHNLSGNIVRLRAANIPLQTFVNFSVGLGQGVIPGGVVFQPGETWHFQTWFRELGWGSNTSSPMTILWR